MTSNHTFIERPPRIQPELPNGEVDIPTPPNHNHNDIAAIMQMALPLLMIVGFIMVAFMGGEASNPLLILPMALSIIASTAFSWYAHREEKQQQAAETKAYQEQLADMRRDMVDAHQMQRIFYQQNAPDAMTILQIGLDTRQPTENRTTETRAGTRLWERRPDDIDFATLRLGIGTRPSTVIYKSPQADGVPTLLNQEAQRLAADSHFVTDSPITIPLRGVTADDDLPEQPDIEERGDAPTQIIHSLGVAGAAADVYPFASALVAQYVTLHSPHDARLFVLGGVGAPWEWIHQLPHAQKDDQGDALCFLDQLEETAVSAHDDEIGLPRYLETLRKRLARRRLHLNEHDQEARQDDPKRPFLLLIVDLLNLASNTSPLANIESDAAVAILQQAGAELGAAILFLVPNRNAIPSDCRAVVEIEQTAAGNIFRYAETGINTLRYVGKADAIPNPHQLHAFTDALRHWEVRKNDSATLVKIVPFLAMLDQPDLDSLHTHTRHNWERSTQPNSVQPLRVRVGYMAGNKPRALVLSAKRDGVHGMIAGSTGSGKSELLISMIAALAVNYDPTMLNFVLVDYKGGGAFQDFAKLPHCVEVITNLQKAGVSRMFTAINAEMKRRQQLNAQTDTKDILEYQRKGHHLSHAPYPYLFIIIDEFAEMIAGNAQFKVELDMITRLGRAQGISLLLAAQRPTGITDQMRANIKFRICLRVETPGESREMLRRTDAAFLPGNIPGRGYLQVGNEDIDLIQVAYAGDRAVDPHAPDEPAVLWLGRQDEYLYEDSQEPESPKLYQAVINLLCALAEEAGCTTQHAPWPEALPHPLTLTTVLPTTEHLVQTELIGAEQAGKQPIMLQPWLHNWLNGRSHWPPLNWHDQAMRVVVGLVDNPYEACQLPLSVNLRRGHAVIFGTSGWGKTIFLRTLVASLAATHPPNLLHIYLLDMGGRNLAPLNALPQVGSVIMPDEEGFNERVAYLLSELAHLLDSRKLLLNQHGVEDIYQYNSLHPTEAQPIVLLGIDNFADFVEIFGNSRDDVETNLDRLTALARQSRPYGIHLLITTQLPADLSSKLGNLFNERLTLRQSDPALYREILGTAVPEIEEVTGRGFIKDGHRPLTFQVGLLLPPHESQRGRNADLQAILNLGKPMQSAGDWTESGPMSIGALPKTVSYKQMAGLQTDAPLWQTLSQQMNNSWTESREPEHADWLTATLGIAAGNKPRTLHFSALRDGVHGMIAGGTGSGKSEMLMTLIVDMALKYDPSILNFVLVDYKGGGAFKPFEELPHCVDSVTNLDGTAVSRMFIAINAEMERRQRLNADTGVKDIVDYRRKGYHLSQDPYPHIFIIIDEYAEMIVDKPEFKGELDRITRVGRSLGISLILASQKPIGVSDQMRANIKFRLCLRVEGVNTSREMLRRSDAAFLPSGMPGRGYLQIGNDNLELIQVAYTGETAVTADNKQEKLFALAVQTAQTLMQERRLPDCPWPPILPNGRSGRFALNSLLDAHYIPPVYHPVLKATEKATTLMPNPQIVGWLNGTSHWTGVDWMATALRPVIGLVDHPQQACQRPLILNLARGHAAIFGASGMGKTVALRTLVCSLAVTHAPPELNVLILDLGGRQLRPLHSLPHVGSVILPDEAGFEDRVRQLVRELQQVVERRQRKLADDGLPSLLRYNEQAESPLAAILVLIDNFAEFQELFAEGGETTEQMLIDLMTLMRQARTYGIHFVITASDPNHVPNKLLNLFSERLTLRLGGDADYQAVLGQKVTEIPDLPGRGYTLVNDQALTCQIALPLPETGTESRLQTLLAALASGEWHGAEPLQVEALPQACLYKPLLTKILALDGKRPFLAELRRVAQQKWAASIQQENANWLTATLGVAAGNHPRTLRFSAKADGVHGLVAGGTGSGKSELLTTLIVGMALHYDPSILNFVLVDYKGGGAFQAFTHLPHCMDIITNLNQAAVTRMFTAINAEIKRRQQLNADTGVKDIVDYHGRGYHLTKEPYPFLFIIIDEYAEMISDNRDFLQELESITRVGRSLGITLILASQRPTGVTDQMRSNIKFRICLRVEGIDESREMLRLPDAAYLPNGMPGRGYLQIGNDELHLMQIAYTGDAYPTAQRPEDAEPPKLFDVIVRIAADLAQQPDAPPRRPRPWPDFLPESLALTDSIQTDYLIDEQTAVSDSPIHLNTYLAEWLSGHKNSWPPVVWNAHSYGTTLGLIDNPNQASQHLLRLQLAQAHHVLFGSSGYGKTAFLRSLMVDLATTYTPNLLQMFVLDLGGHSFGSLRQLPHLGDVIMPDDAAYEERLVRLLERLHNLVQERKQTFSQVDARDLVHYNVHHPQQPLPLLLILIDNFAELKENFEALVDEQLIPLMRQGRPYGLTFFLTANAPSAIPGKLYNLLGKRLTLTLADSGHYLDIVGRGAALLEPIAGRGLVRMGKRPLTFQSVLPVNITATGEDEQLRQLATKLRQAWSGSTPDLIHILPREISLQTLLAQAAAPETDTIEFMLGLDNNLKPAYCNVQRNGPHFGIVGPPLSGKTTALINVCLSLASRHAPEQVGIIIIDLNRKFIQYGGEQSLANLPHVCATLTQPAGLPALVAQIAQTCHAMAAKPETQKLVLLIENFDDLCEEVEGDHEIEDALNELAKLAGRHGTDGLHVLLAGALEVAHPLKKRVLSGGYGLGLRDTDSLTTLRAYVRGSVDLPPGRGYIVNGGQLMKVQVAQPYPSLTQSAEALDQWVTTIQEKYPDFISEAGFDVEMEAADISVSNTQPPDDQSAGDAIAYLKEAIAQRSLADGISLTELGIDMETMSNADVLRFAETYFPVPESSSFILHNLQDS